MASREKHSPCPQGAHSRQAVHSQGQLDGWDARKGHLGWKLLGGEGGTPQKKTTACLKALGTAGTTGGQRGGGRVRGDEGGRPWPSQGVLILSQAQWEVSRVGWGSSVRSLIGPIKSEVSPGWSAENRLVELRGPTCGKGCGEGWTGSVAQKERSKEGIWGIFGLRSCSSLGSAILKVWLIEQGRGQQKGPLPWSRWGSSEGCFQPWSSLGDDQDLKTEI